MKEGVKAELTYKDNGGPSLQAEIYFEGFTQVQIEEHLEREFGDTFAAGAEFEIVDLDVVLGVDI